LLLELAETQKVEDMESINSMASQLKSAAERLQPHLMQAKKNLVETLKLWKISKL
jgi:hypothetical protein